MYEPNLRRRNFALTNDERRLKYDLIAISARINFYALLVQQMYAAPEARVGRTPAFRVIVRFCHGIATD